MTDSVIIEFKNWIGEDAIRYFKHLKGLTGTYSPVLKLNPTKKGMAFHAIHFREGMQIRNWMRGQLEFEKFSAAEFDDNWEILVEKACNLK